MSDLAFIDQNHIYLHRGRAVPCVSDLCRFLHREIYREAPLWQVEQAAARGTAVHAATQQLDATGAASIDEEYAPYLQAYAAFLRAHTPSWSLIEQPLYSPEDDYAGTIDRYGLLNSRHTLLDIKTTYTVHKPLCLASLNLYRRLLESNGHPVERLCILHLKKDCSYKLLDFSMDDAIIHALLTLHRALKRKERKTPCLKK